MAVLTRSLEMQISKTRFPSDSSLTVYAPAEARVIPVIAALAWDRPAKIGIWIPETKAGSLSSLYFQGLTGRSNSKTGAETKKRQLGNSGKLGVKRRLEYTGMHGEETNMGNRFGFRLKVSICTY